MSRVKMRHAKKQPGFWGAVWGNRSLGARIAIVSATALISLILLVCVAVHVITGRPVWVWIDTLFYTAENLEIDENFQDLTPEDLGVAEDIHFPEGITNIALFGIDSREENMKGLSDSMMILSVDGNNNNIKLVSLQRDSLVPIDGHGWQKLTHAYSFGGATLAVKTINKVYKMNITDYATVDFVGMAAIIEAVGGIDTVMTEAEVKNANKQVLEMHLTRGTPLDYIQGSGKMHLNGIQAVAYSRVRKADVHKDIAGDELYDFGDYGRTLRQRYVMSQLFSKALSLKIGEYPELIQSLIPLMQTSLSYGEIYDLAMILLKDGVALKEDRIPADKAIIKKGASVVGLGSCEYYDLDFAAELLHAFFFENTTFEDYIAVNGVKKNGKVPSSMFVTNSTSSSASDEEDEGDEVTDTGTGTETEDWVDRPSNNKGTGNKGTGSSGGGGDETTDTPEKPDTSLSGSEDGSSSDASDETDSSDSSDSSDSADGTSSENKPSSSGKPTSSEGSSDKEETSEKSETSDDEE